MKKVRKFSFSYWNQSILKDIFFFKYSSDNYNNLINYEKIIFSLTIKDFESSTGDDQSFKSAYLLNYFYEGCPLVTSVRTKVFKNEKFYDGDIQLIVRRNYMFKSLEKLVFWGNHFFRYDWKVEPSKISKANNYIPQIRLVNIASIPQLADDPNLFKIDQILVLNFYIKNISNLYLLDKSILNNRTSKELLKSFVSPFFNILKIKNY